MEVKSELYEETDFNSVSTENGSEWFSHIVWFNCDHESENKNIFADVISKFRFSMPSDHEKCLALQHDNENDIVVRRKINEFIEIGMMKYF